MLAMYGNMLSKQPLAPDLRRCPAGLEIPTVHCSLINQFMDQEQDETKMVFFSHLLAPFDWRKVGDSLRAVNDLVELGIGKGGIVQLVVSVSPVANHVHEHVLAVATLVRQRQTGRFDHALKRNI